MKIQYVIDEALRLADEEGNEDEYKLKIISAINHVLAKITKFAKSKKVFEDVTSFNKEITLPSMINLISIKDSDGNDVYYEQIDNNKIIVSLDGTYRICYNAILDKVEQEADVNNELEIDSIADECLIYGVAAEISMDNEDLYPILQNEYNNLLANLALIPEVINQGSEIKHIEGLWF